MPSRTAARRPPPRGPAPPLPVGPVGQLPARPLTWPRTAALWTAAGLAGGGAAPLLGRPGLAGPVFAVGLAAAVVAAVLGSRAARRHQLLDRLLEALAPQLGLRGVPDRRVLSTRGWERGWPGTPNRLDLRYAPVLDDTDPAWRAGLLATVSRVLLAPYEFVHHDRRRGRLRLLRVDPEETAPAPALQARAERTIAELLGPSAALRDLQWATAAEGADGTSDDGARELRGLDVTHQAGAKVAAAQFRHRVERVVSTMLPGRWRARWDLVGDAVRFEVRPALPQLVALPTAAVTDATRFRLPMAIGEDGQVITWNLRGSGIHCMVVGRTGTGKTVVIRDLVLGACVRQWPVWICDPKRVEFMGLRGWPNVQVVATTVEDQVALIYRAWEEMERRYAQVEAGQADEDDFEPLILVLDEYRDFMGSVADWYARIKVRGMPAKCPVFEKVASLARKGRTGRVHVVLGTQRPDADFLGGEMRDNFATRISLGPLSPQGAVMMWEAPYLGVSVPRRIPGRGTAVTDDDTVVEVQGYWTPDPRRVRAEDRDDLTALAQLRPAVRTHPPLQVQLPEELLHPDDGDPRLWEAVLAAELVPSLDPPPEFLPPAPTYSPTALLARVAAPRPSSGCPDVGPGPVEDLGGTVDLDGVEDDYDTADELRADQLAPGDLVLVDESAGLWAVVEGAEPDFEDPDAVCVDWRTDDDGAGSLSLPADQTLPTRRPVELQTGDDA